LIASSRLALLAAIRSFRKLRTSGDALSGEPELNGGAGLYRARAEWFRGFPVGQDRYRVSAKSMPAVTPRR